MLDMPPWPVCDSPGLKYGEARQLRGERLELLNENKERLKLQEEENEEVRDTSGSEKRTLAWGGQRKRWALEKETPEWRVADDVCNVFKPTNNVFKIANTVC